MAKTNIDNKIKLLRFMNDEMTQAELAEQVGLTRQTIAAIEQNKYSPSLEVAFQIAEIFGLELDGVFSYKSSNKK